MFPNDSYNEKAINRSWSNQKANPVLKTKMGNNQNHKFNENKWPPEMAAISQKAVTQQPKTNQKYNEQT